MRLIILSLICGILLLAPMSARETQAQGRQGPSPPTAVVGPNGRGQPPDDVQRALPEGQSAPEGILDSSNQQSSDSLRIPAGAFSPATLTQYVGVADDSDADQSYFSLFHSAKYSDSARVGGFYQRADWNAVTFRYLASVFDSASAALAMLHDGESHTQAGSGSNLVDCSAHYQTPCGSLHYITTAANSGQYIVLQVNQCLLETAASAPTATWNSQTEQIIQTTETIAAAGLQAAHDVCGGTPAAQAQTAPVPPSPLTIDQILLSHTVKGALKSTRMLLSKEKGLFAVYYHQESTRSGTPSATITFTVDGKTIRTDAMELATLTDGTTYFAAQDSFTAQKRAIHTVAQVALTLGSSTAATSLDFTVKPNKRT